MTLGKFRELTRNYDDDCELLKASDVYNIDGAVTVIRVVIDIKETDRDDPFSLTPEIIVL